MRTRTAEVARRAVLLITLVIAAQVAGQMPAQGQAPATGNAPAAPPGGAAGAGRGGGLGAALSTRPPADPEKVERGRGLYGVRCTFCHGADARGGEGGPNIVRSGLVLNDIDGELIAPIIQNGRPELGMPKFDLTLAQISDVAAFLRTFRVGGRDTLRNPLPNVLVGDAKAGEVYFNAKCASCHSVTGDLKGLGSKFSDPKALQQRWLMPGGGRGAAGAFPKTVTVTVSANQKFEGRLDRIDDFTVTLIEANGNSRTFIRKGPTPAVEVHDPLRPHKNLLPGYTDNDIHNVTAYLATIK